jgi:hypothetical protein
MKLFIGSSKMLRFGCAGVQVGCDNVKVGYCRVKVGCDNAMVRLWWVKL